MASFIKNQEVDQIPICKVLKLKKLNETTCVKILIWCQWEATWDDNWGN